MNNPFINRIIENLILAPGVVLLALLVVFVLLHRQQLRLAKWFLILTMVFLYIGSLPVVSRNLAVALDSYPAQTLEGIAQQKIEAIVILGSGRYPNAPEYGGGDTLSGSGLFRVRYGAWLHRRTGLPVLVTGGRPGGEERSEAQLMRQVLVEEFMVPVTWLEQESRTTAENAFFSQKILAEAGIKKVLLVTHSNHMVRAVAAFQAAGLEVVAAPTQFPTESHVWPFLDWIPNRSAQAGIGNVLHEQLGRVWYEIQFMLRGSK